MNEVNEKIINHIYRGRTITLQERDILLPSGTVSRRFPVVTHEDGAIVVPVVEKETGVSIMLIRQWRPAMSLMTLEVPGGGLLEEETPEQAAEREVREEAGLIVERLQKLGEVLPAPGWDIEKQFHFIAFCKSEIYEQPQDDVDHIERVLAPVDKVIDMLKRREITDLKTRAILLDALLYIGRLEPTQI